MRNLVPPVVLFALLSLFGCSTTFHTYTQTLDLAFNQGDGASLSKAELATRESDVLYAKVGTLPNAVMVLAYLEHGQYKWVSADEAMLVLEKGRLVKTTGFENNLVYVSATELDPLKQPMAKIQVGQQWQVITDWSGKAETGHLLSYEIIHTEVSSIEVLDHNFQTKLITELVTFPNGQTAINQFWFDLKSGWLLKSRQNIAPFWPQVELIHVSSAGRLLGVIKQGSLR